MHLYITAMLIPGSQIAFLPSLAGPCTRPSLLAVVPAERNTSCPKLPQSMRTLTPTVIYDTCQYDKSCCEEQEKGDRSG